MMRAVVDTNILIRALIKPQGTVGPVLRRLAAGEYVLVYSEPLLDELLAKLVLPRIRRKYHISDEAIEQTLALFALRGEAVRPARTVRICRDPADNMLIEAALAGNAACIVSGDEDLLVLKEFERVRIITARTFLQML
jgi:putative PIN family toxin of toxin-antitoxin system